MHRKEELWYVVADAVSSPFGNSVDPAALTWVDELPTLRTDRTELADHLQTIMEETNDPILQGPVKRPDNEKELLEAAHIRSRARCPFPRNGLTSAFEAQKSGKYLPNAASGSYESTARRERGLRNAE